MEKLSEFRNGSVSIGVVRDAFTKLNNISKDKVLKEFIQNVLSLDERVFEEFLLKVLFALDEDYLIEKCKAAIKADKIPEEKIEDVFCRIDSSIRSDNYINIRNNVKIQISFDDFYLKYRRYYDVARNGTLQIKEFCGALPDDLKAQTFIQQLLEVEDVRNEDMEEIVMFTRFKLKLQNNIDNWVKNGEITEEEVDRFKKDAIDQWSNKFRQAFRGVTAEADFNLAGIDVLDSIRDKKLIILEQLLDTDLSNGLFYDLSEIPEIGWRKYWEKYKND